jgi:acetate kinase
MEQTILCLNGGSSSLKFAVYRIAGAAEERVFSGAVEAIGALGGRFWLRGVADRVLTDLSGNISDHGEAIKTMFAALQQQGVKQLTVAGHRIVHGGPFFCAPQRVNARVTDKLRELVPFAPLHLPSQVAMIEAVSAHYPDLPQVVCFDTAFHRGMPEVAQRFALPRELWDQGIRRYGFHGLSYEFIVSHLGKAIGSRAIIAHLGNGASMVALKDGMPLDTSMGLTPTGGFMMGTRSGDLDPGVLLYLMRKGYSPEKLETLLDHESGLRGVSGETNDMKTLLEKREAEPSAALAVEMFCYQVRKSIGSFAAVLNGLDTLVFTGGIGERAALVRAEICGDLKHLEIELDIASNQQNAAVISTGRCTVRVVQTDEDLMIARHAREVVLANTID